MPRSSSVKARIVAIGNSQRVPIPKALLEHAGLGSEVELHAENGRIVLAAAQRARAGWAEAAAQLHARAEGVLVELDPTRGSEIKKTRPCLIVSPDELNHHLRTVIVAPMATGGHAYPFRPDCRFGGKNGRVALDQLRTIDRERARKRVGVLSPANRTAVLAVLAEMFEFS